MFIYQEVSGLLKVSIIPTLIDIVVQVRIFRLKMANMPLSSKKFLLEMVFLPLSTPDPEIYR
jgi:hypothetical protein